MFLVNSFLKSGSGGGGGGGLGNTLRGLISGARGGSCGGGGGGTATRFLGGVVSATGETAAKYNPGPPPPPTHYSNIEPNESERVRQFRRLFAQLAGDDMEVSATELMNILNKVVTRHPDLKTDGLDTDMCCSMVAVMDSDTTGKMGFKEFKYLWNNIKKWQSIYSLTVDRSGTIGSSKLPGDFEAAGFRLNDHLYNMTIGRYSDEVGNMDFDNFISCLVRLDAMFRAFKSLDKDGTGQTQVNIQEWLQLTMYS
ncbi:calpain small subunit 1-like [Camelus ferus]|uniref:Calpain small subunit 1 n=1 Tax=Camelus ferus TaxID=419612 RepID=A0A8B8TYJ1_CAMFR|nr:calpain small subunit 1-like [Camelus ferus]